MYSTSFSKSSICFETRLVTKLYNLSFYLQMAKKERDEARKEVSKNIYKTALPDKSFIYSFSKALWTKMLEMNG